MSESLDFDLALREVPVKLRNKDGEVKEYVLREASGETASKYRNAALAALELGPEGKPKRIHNAASVEVMLVALCLYEVINGEVTKKPVPAATIDAWPARVKKDLFNKVKDISELTEEGPEKQTLEEILARHDSPVSLADFRKYLEALPDEDEEYNQDYRPFKTWFKPSAEEKAKND